MSLAHVGGRGRELLLTFSSLGTPNLAFMALKVDSLWSSEANPKSTPVRIEARVQGVNGLSFPR